VWTDVNTGVFGVAGNNITGGQSVSRLDAVDLCEKDNTCRLVSCKTDPVTGNIGKCWAKNSVTTDKGDNWTTYHKQRPFM
jgi:hypothetical protein